MIDTGANTATGWFPVLTSFLGFAASKREREARDSASRAQRFERRANFQRETLLNLQDSVAKLARATGRMHHFDLTEHRKTGKWRASLFPEGFSDDAQQATVLVMLLTSRVRDDDIRELAETFRSAATWVTLCPNKEDSEAALSKMSETLGWLHKRTEKFSGNWTTMKILAPRATHKGRYGWLSPGRPRPPPLPTEQEMERQLYRYVDEHIAQQVLQYFPHIFDHGRNPEPFQAPKS